MLSALERSANHGKGVRSWRTKLLLIVFKLFRVMIPTTQRRFDILVLPEKMAPFQEIKKKKSAIIVAAIIQMLVWRPVCLLGS